MMRSDRVIGFEGLVMVPLEYRRRSWLCGPASVTLSWPFRVLLILASKNTGFAHTM